MDLHTQAQPALPLAAVPTSRVQAVPHPTETVEQGSFTLARCGCGWRGPARRSRDKAREDAAGHPAAADPDQ
ncbi:hypothetical protein [Streptomyces venezuelae]|uniref:hypothetical protein n=1 Tax=Streptomyces venezuelae TaxID=54571 RepID=UPI0016815860|nr:hypothetical protein [Streptomyces venezuelae]